ncbi:hypothetical protein SERN_1842 [Serinibacter arcticus]|uniref:Uncharacterized protein n=1 Tax=Serinibacter arcticus TaxID=1655435 RepID=A0A4Z1DZ97_9MICO|nr:hypothetical protein SERN_1842 [Serinibacter arcticus]
MREVELAVRTIDPRTDTNSSVGPARVGLHRIGSAPTGATVARR